MEATTVFPLSPPPQRTFLYSEAYKHNSLDVADFAQKTREIRLISSTSPTRVPSSLKCGDIARSMPNRRIPVEAPRRWYDERGKCGSLTTVDIAGAQPLSRMKPKWNKPDRMTNCSDIHGAYPSACKALSDRMVDPLAPMYVIPSWKAGPAPKAPPPRCAPGRSVLDHQYSPARTDFFSTEGIAGAQPLVKYMQWKQRESTFLQNHLVEGASPPKKRIYKDRRNPLHVSDINDDPEGAGHVFKSMGRCTNVLEPRYDWNPPQGVTKGEWQIGEIGKDKSRSLMNAYDAPKVLHGVAMPPKDAVLGSQPKMLHELQLGKAVAGFEYLQRPREEVRNTNHIADIDGANADSVRPGMTTKRITDPLRPEYVWPGLAADLGSDAFSHTPDRVASPLLELPPTPLPSLPPSPSKHQDELEKSLRQVKEVFHSRGAYAGRALARVVRNFDDGDGMIDKEELHSGLRNYLGYEMDRQDFAHVWRYFDKDDSGEISVEEFLHGIRGNLNKTRLSAVQEAFEKMDRDSSGEISINEIEALYDVTHHPRVVTGEWSRREALHDFLSQWDADNEGGVSREEFMDFMKDVSLGMDSDAEFMQAIKNIFPTLAPSGRRGGQRSSTGNTPDPSQLTPGRLARQGPRSQTSLSGKSTPKSQAARAALQADMELVRNIQTPALANQRPVTPVTYT